MNAKKFYYGMIALLCAMIAGAGAMIYFGSSFMQKSSVNLVNAKLESFTTEEKEKSYLQARKDLEKYKDLDELANKILPKNKDQAKAVSELYKIASESGIVIDKIQFPTSTLGQKAAATTTSTAKDTAATAASPVTQAKAVEGLTSVLGIDIEVSSAKGMKYSNMIKFLQKIELNRRSLQVKKISVTPDLSNNVLDFNVTVTTFVKP